VKLKNIIYGIKQFIKFFGTFLMLLFITLLAIVFLFCKGPSESARNLFVTTFLETGKMKFIVSIFLNDQEIQNIVNANSMSTLNEDVNTSLIDVTNTDDSEIKIEQINGSNYSGTMMIVKNPKKVFVGTTYPWTEYGIELDKIVSKYNAVGGINGGIYVSTMNKGGRPLGLVVSNGEIQNNNATEMAGLYLIGFDQSNILRIISLENKNTSEIEEIVSKEKIRDAVTFQDEMSDANNHFVKLIVNGETRELNGTGSGANPRTVIGQKSDGTVLLLVTDGRGANGHLGATASDLIEIMQKYGAINAANLDGGSSSSMYYNNEYLRTSVTLYYSNSSWRIPTAFLVSGE
jgi:exopolysaccharide biosynthesis protein